MPGLQMTLALCSRWDQLLKSRTLDKAPNEFVDTSLLFFLFLSFLVES